MEAAIRRFLENLRAEQGRAANTVLAYRADLQQFERSLAEAAGRPVTLSDLTPDALSAYMRWLSQPAYRPATLSRKMAAVRSFLEYLSSREGVGEPGLAAGLRAPPAPRRRSRVLAQQEVTALLQTAGRAEAPRGLRDAAILSLLYATGMRAADAVALRVGDIDLDQGRVNRPAPRQESMPLGIAAEAMRRYLQNGRPHLVRDAEMQALFLNQRGRQLSRQGLWLVVKRWAALSGLGADVSPHSLRHALAQHLLGQGKTRREVQQLLGLSSPNAVRSHPEVPKP